MNAEVYQKQKDYFFYLEQKKYLYSTIFGAIVSHLILAPFYVTSIQKQLSIDAHKYIYSDTADLHVQKLTYKQKIQLIWYNPSKIRQIVFNKINVDINELNNNKKLVEINRNLDTIKSENSIKPFIVSNRERINNELIQASGVPENQRPYRAPIYDTYSQMLKSFNKQGILSLWKGTYYRIFFFIGPICFLPSVELRIESKTKFFSDYASYKTFIQLTSMSLLETLMHPLFYTENRYILQNRLPHFRTYQSFLGLYSRTIASFYTGCLGHLIKNIALITGIRISDFVQKVFKENNESSYNVNYISGLTLSYPILTALRRITCQTIKDPGMLPPRYLNLLHAIFLIRREEGLFKGLYKGYLPFFIATFCYLHISKYVTINYNLFSLQIDTLENDELFNQLILNNK